MIWALSMETTRVTEPNCRAVDALKAKPKAPCLAPFIGARTPFLLPYRLRAGLTCMLPNLLSLAYPSVFFCGRPEENISESPLRCLINYQNGGDQSGFSIEEGQGGRQRGNMAHMLPPQGR